MKKSAVISLILATALGCAQTAQYTPRPSNKNYKISGLRSHSVNVQINDLRPEAGSSDGLAEVLQKQVESALSPGPVSLQGAPYKLQVDIIEHRSFFTLGNWNASTRLRTQLIDSQGNQVGQWEAVGVAHRSNMFGYATAAAVSQDAYDIAVADMMSSLSQVTIK